MAESQQMIKAPKPGTLQHYLDQPGYKARFNEVLGARAPQFISSLLSIAAQPHLSRVEPRSLLQAAMTAAALDLPINPSLGFAYIVPYNNTAQCQIGFRGYIQLAMRTGQYNGMNAFLVNAEALGGFNNIGDRQIDWEKLDETKAPVGYAFAWTMINGFSKVVYWPREKVAAHAEKYSRSHQSHIKKGYPKGNDCRWCSDFDAMALKTVIISSLRRWGFMSTAGASQFATALQSEDAIEIESAGYEEQQEPAQLEAAPEAEPARVAEPVTSEPQKTDAQPHPGKSEPTGERGRLLDAFNNLVEVATLKIAKDTLEATTGTKLIDKVPDALIEKAIHALNTRAKADI